jgi:hypothetical protein
MVLGDEPVLTTAEFQEELAKVQRGHQVAMSEPGSSLHGAWELLIGSYRMTVDTGQPWGRGHYVGCVDMFTALTYFKPEAVVAFVQKVVAGE